MPGTRVRLDNPAFAGRIKTHSRRSTLYERRSVVSRAPAHRLISDMRPSAPKPGTVQPSAPVSNPAPLRSVAKAVPSRQSRSKVLKRQIVKVPVITAKRGQRRHRSPKNAVLTVLAAVLFVFGLGVGGMQLLTNHKAQAQVQALHTSATAESSNDPASPGLPSETLPDTSVDDYSVGARIPRVLRIAKLGVEARILNLDLGANNQLKAPSNIFDTGWYNGSALPGESGAVLIDGHVHGPTKPGVFVSLKKLVAGDKITLERGDGKVFTYRVAGVRSYDKDAVDMGAAFSSAEPGKPGLNLITCDGSYDEEGRYDSRLLIFAVQE